MANQTQKHRDEGGTFARYVAGHGAEISAWNDFVDKYKGDFAQQSAVKLTHSLWSKAFGEEDREKVEKRVGPLWDKIDSLTWKIHAKHEMPDGELIDLMDNKGYLAELLTLPGMSSRFGFLESLLEANLPTARQLAKMTGETDENPYGGFNLGTYFGDEMIKAYAERTFLGEIHAAQREGANKTIMAKLIQKSRDKISMDKEKRVASYPSHLDVNYWLDHPKEHGLAFSVTHMLNTYVGRGISPKLSQLEEGLEGD